MVSPPNSIFLLFYFYTIIFCSIILIIIISSPLLPFVCSAFSMKVTVAHLQNSQAVNATSLLSERSINSRQSKLTWGSLACYPKSGGRQRDVLSWCLAVRGLSRPPTERVASLVLLWFFLMFCLFSPGLGKEELGWTEAQSTLPPHHLPLFPTLSLTLVLSPSFGCAKPLSL